MKINEVEEIVGITKKNIRFYEQQGLLTPGRNSENGYRNYSEDDVNTLKKIKLLRKLAIPIEEIKRMLLGNHTVSDGMKRHLVSLERDMANTQQAMILCRELMDKDVFLSEIDADEILSKMEQMEKGGTAFYDRQKKDIRIRYAIPVIITVMMVLFMSGMIALVMWSYKNYPQDAPPVWFVWLTVLIFMAIISGVILALIQRIKEIEKGEIDDAKRY